MPTSTGSCGRSADAWKLHRTTKDWPVHVATRLNPTDPSVFANSWKFTVIQPINLTEICVFKSSEQLSVKYYPVFLFWVSLGAEIPDWSNRSAHCCRSETIRGQFGKQFDLKMCVGVKRTSFSQFFLAMFISLVARCKIVRQVFSFCVCLPCALLRLEIACLYTQYLWANLSL